MNVLYISSKKGWGGVVTWMCRTALALERRHHRVWIVSHPDSRLTRSAPEGIRIVPKRLGMDYNPIMVAWLVGFIRRQKVDLVVTNIQKEVVIGGLAARLSGIPNIRRIGNRDDLNDRVKWSQKFLVNHSIVPCMATFEEARRRHPWLAPDRFTTVYNGLNPTTYSEGDIAEVRRTWGLTADHLVIGCTSGLAKVKGIDRLISVFAGLCGEYPRARLVLTGEGPEEAELRGQVRQAGIEDGVVFAGFSGETPKVAAAYDISVLNSSLEGFPNVIVEYMAAGRAVISTRVGGVVEIVEHGRNGLLIEPGDDEALGEALRRAMDDPDMRNRLGREARRTVEERFTETSMADSLEAVFSRVAGVDVEEARPEVGDK